MNIASENQTYWAENLPERCPPVTAFQPQNDTYYRLVATVPPIEKDFWSQRKLFPNKKFNDECRACACSILADLQSCIEISKLPTQKNRKIVKVTLPPQSGLIKQTGNRISHFSWWRILGFNPIPLCTEIINTQDNESPL